MAKLGLIDLKKTREKHETWLSLTSDGEEIGDAYLRFWNCVAILISLDFLPEAKEEFEGWMIEQVEREVVYRRCSQLIVYRDNPTAEERELYEHLGLKKSIYGFCRSFSYL